MRRAQEGDVDAAGELYDRHHEPIFRYVWSRVRDRHLAEDLTGEVFARMVANLPGYRPRGVPFRAWLYRIAHNLAVDHYRVEGRRNLVSLDQAEDQSAPDDGPAAVAERRLVLEWILEALGELGPSQREVIELRFLAGMSLRETALILDKTVAAVKALQRRGLKSLRLASR